MKFLVIDCEVATARDQRRAGVGRSGGESFAAVLEQLEPGCSTVVATPADGHVPCPSIGEFARCDAVFLSGSTLHIGDGSAPSQRLIDAMGLVFRSGTPAFGACAGLQVAVVAAGGEVAAMPGPPEAGVARRITATAIGRDHPLLRGRPSTWDALTVHSDEVKHLPESATLLAGNAASIVHAAEIRHDGGIFWGVQYHPEISLREVAAALRRDPASLVRQGAAQSVAEVMTHADLLAALGLDARRQDLALRLKLDDQVIDDAQRRREIRNFIDHFVRS